MPRRPLDPAASPAMTPERWDAVKRLFNDALEREPGERADYLADAAKIDPALAEEARALLSAHGHADGAFDSLTRTGGLKTLAPGTRLGPYEVVEILGSGGMGVVYRARDTRLGREVAVKVLPAELQSDPDRLRRFEQEARAASALNHPNILTVHDVGTSGGAPFITMELVRGHTLRERLAGGPLPPSELIELALQIAAGLAKAHEAGIVHRDLKPENVMVSEDGFVKILDFGLAKLQEPADRPLATAATRTGAVVGTVGYMSPEQLRGEAVDFRSDQFALGALLYEMATGRRAFGRPSAAETLAALLNEQPPRLGELNPQARGLEPLIERCLAKQPRDRYDSTRSLVHDLERLRRPAELPEPAPERIPRRRSRRTTLTMAAAAAALVLVALVGQRLLRNRERAPESFQNALSARVTDQPGPELFPSLSPDGRSIVYAARAKDNWDIFLQRVGGKNPINLTTDSAVDDNHPAFSPDGEQIAFQSDRNGGGIYLMGATGESVRRLTDFGYHPAWSPDGKEIVFASTWIARPEARMSSNSQIWIVTVATGARRRLEIKGGGDAIQPQWSPNGHRFAYWGSVGGRRDIWTVSATGGEAVAVTEDTAIDWNPAWSPDGRQLYFSSDRGGSMNLWRVPIDERSGRLSGPPEAITTPSPDSAQISFSSDGRRLAYVQRVATRNVQKIPFDERVEKTVGQPAWVTQGSKLAVMPEPSPRGHLLAFFTIAPSQEDIFVMAPDGSGLRQLTDDAHRDRTPRWSPDGRQLAFISDRSGKYEIWTINQDGSGLRQATFTSGKAAANSPVWSPDGTRLTYTIQNDTSYVIDLRKPWAEQSPQALPRVSRDEWLHGWTWSADGRTLAGHVMQRSGVSTGIALYAFDSKRYEKLTDFGLYPVWLKDARRLIFCFKEKLYLVDIASKKVREIMHAALSARTGEMLGAASLSADNSTLYFAQGTIEADIWLLSAR